MNRKSYDKLELSIALLGSLRDIMISIESADASQVIPATTLAVFETVLEKVRMLLKEAVELEEKGKEK